MPKTNTAEIVSNIYNLVEPLSDDERARVFAAVHALFGTAPPTEQLPPAPAPAAMQPGAQAPAATPAPARGSMTPKQYFDQKQPQTKIENLLIAGRYREIHGGHESHTQAELRQVIRDARRNFDAHNFRRDISNAKTRHFFTKDRSRDSYTLAHYGQNFADALPDREAAGKIRAPRAARKTTKKTKKKAAKKTGTRTS
jgi:hypothetical protein